MNHRHSAIALSLMLLLGCTYWVFSESEPPANVVNRTIAQLSDASRNGQRLATRVLFEIDTRDGSARACAEYDGQELCARESLPREGGRELGRYTMIASKELSERTTAHGIGADAFVYNNRLGRIFRYHLEGIDERRSLKLEVMAVRPGLSI